MHFNSLWVLQVLSEFGHFYRDETNEPPSEQGPIVTDSELIH